MSTTPAENYKHVVIAHSDVVIVCRPGQPILDAAHAQGIALPYACRRGICGLCAAELVQGEVMPVDAWPMTNDQCEAGQVLLCRCTPACDEDRGRNAMHPSHRNSVCKPVADKHSRHIGNQHAQRGPGHHHHRRGVVGSHGHGGDLGFVPHFGQKKSDQGGAKHPQATGHVGLVFLDVVGYQGPGRHRQERQAQHPTQHPRTQYLGDPGPQGPRQPMVHEGG